MSSNHFWLNIDDGVVINSDRLASDSSQVGMTPWSEPSWDDQGGSVSPSWQDPYLDLPGSDHVWIGPPLLSERLAVSLPDLPATLEQNEASVDMPFFAPFLGCTPVPTGSQNNSILPINSISNNRMSHPSSNQESSGTPGSFEGKELVPRPMPPINLIASNRHGSDEVALFMHYLDQVFYIKFPFYNPSADEKGRGWLFTLLTQDQPIYHATLALSQYHQYTIQLKSSHITCNAPRRNKYYVSALRQLKVNLGMTHTWDGTLGLVRSIQALTCILQLLFFEIFSGGTGDWSLHLRTAATLIRILVKAHMSLSNQISLHLEHQSERQNIESLSPEYHVAIRFLLGAFLWLDILACASTRSKPFLDLNHSHLLEVGSIQLDKLVGCENWAALAIFKISSLDNWKKSLERECKLSITELAKRGAQIEVGLKEGLSTISVYDTSQAEKFLGVVPRFSRVASAKITQVYALSALTYLHVVVSGAFPNLPEIEDSVSITIDALRVLADLGFLHNLVWPFCVTSCLASEEQQGILGALISAAVMDEKTFGVLRTAFKLIEECWEERKAGLTNCDWTCVMNSIGSHVLLV